MVGFIHTYTRYGHWCILATLGADIRVFVATLGKKQVFYREVIYLLVRTVYILKETTSLCTIATNLTTWQIL